MNLSIFLSETAATPSTVVSSALPTLAPSPMLYRLSPLTQTYICVWILSSPCAGLAHLLSSVQPPRRQQISPTPTLLMIAYQLQSTIHLWDLFHRRLPPPASAGLLQAMDFYMDYLNCLAQASPDQQRWVTAMVIQGIKDMFPYLPSELKDSVSLKKAQKGDGNWEVKKEILG